MRNIDSYPVITPYSVYFELFGQSPTVVFGNSFLIHHTGNNITQGYLKNIGRDS